MGQARIQKVLSGGGVGVQKISFFFFFFFALVIIFFRGREGQYQHSKRDTIGPPASTMAFRWCADDGVIFQEGVGSGPPAPPPSGSAHVGLFLNQNNMLMDKKVIIV